MTQVREAALRLSIDARRSSCTRRGALRGGVLLAIVCAACLAGAITLVIGLSTESTDIANVSTASETHARSSEPRALDTTEPASSASAATDAPSESVNRAPIGTAPPASSANGRGVIRGRLSAAPGLTVPAQWKLVLFPNAQLQGHERADSRTIEFAHGETTFRVDDLPLGGYGVRAEAGGLNGLTVSVLLVQGAENQFVTLVLERAGAVQGGVVDVHDRPADGVPVTLESSATRARRTLETDVAGGYRFDDVTDGEYTLYIGRPEAPLLPPISLAFKAPFMTVTEKKLPATGVAEVWTRDENGLPLADVAVSGFSAHAGVIDARTGKDGSVTVRHLPAGRYRLHARLEDGRNGTALANVDAGETATIDIRLER